MSEVDADVQGSGASEEVGLSLRAAVSVFVGATPLLYSPRIPPCIRRLRRPRGGGGPAAAEDGELQLCQPPKALPYF